MLSKEEFEKIELEHGCGYWNLCWEHACPCAITTENKGLREDIYNGFIEENKKLAQEYDELDDIEMPRYETCRQCGNIFEEFELTCGLCFECYEENENYEGEEDQ